MPNLQIWYTFGKLPRHQPATENPKFTYSCQMYIVRDAWNLLDNKAKILDSRTNSQIDKPYSMVTIPGVGRKQRTRINESMTSSYEQMITSTPSHDPPRSFQP